MRFSDLCSVLPGGISWANDQAILYLLGTRLTINNSLNNLTVTLENKGKLQTNNYLAQIILMVRSDPVEQIRNVLEQVAAARGLTQVHNEQSYGKGQKPTRHQ